MTARPLRRVVEADPLRVLKGRRLNRPSLAPWMIMALIGVVAFLGLGFARTSLDRSAFELSELTTSIDEATAVNQGLSLEIARLENPARIAPLAEDLGLVIPSNTNQLLVDLSPAGPTVAEAEHEGATQ
jgi:predicted lysophospholipase L1 biosynthesis ABC-type transport system permease subunit